MVWASGSNGVILRSIDEGKTWQRFAVIDGDGLDFRGIVAFGATAAYVMSSGEGEKSRIYKTTDGGVTWKLQYSDNRKEFFLDSIACFSESRCVALGDPINGKFVLVKTIDGENWKELPTSEMPSALGREGAFAASNSCIALSGEKEIFFGTGGPAARVFHSEDDGLTWTVARTPLVQGNTTSGIFALALKENGTLIALGGDYKEPLYAERVAAHSLDNGKSWQLATRQPGGYRSAIAHIEDGRWVAVGPTGGDITEDNGAHWKHIDSHNFNAVAISSGQMGWAAGAKGVIARFLDHGVKTGAFRINEETRPRHCRDCAEGIVSRVGEKIFTEAEMSPLSDFDPNHNRNERKEDNIGSRPFLPCSGRRMFLQGAAATAAALALPAWTPAHPGEMDAIGAEIEKRHDESVKRLQTWIRQPSIAAENRGMNEGCELMMQMLREAGFGSVKKMPTDGQPGVFATLDAGAAKTLGLYFMYDVKQADPTEWSSPPFEAALVDKPNLGKVIMGRGAVNQKGPEATFLAALHAIRGAGQKMPVNLVFVAEGEEEIGSPHFPQVVHQAEVMAAMKKCLGIFMPSASQGPDGEVTATLGAKGVIECELISSGERWGRGPRKDVHSSNKARLDSPAWHLVEALTTLVSPDGNDPAIEGFADKARPLSDAEKKMIAEAARRLNEEEAKKLLGVEHWVHDVSWREALELLMSRPTVNIEGLVGGYTGPGGKTILPGKAVAKLDLRLVPDMTAAEAFAALKAHLVKKGFGDIEVHMSGGYDPTSTPADSGIVKAGTAVYKKNGIDPVVLPRTAGSWPGYIFTGAPLRLPADHFGLGHGSGAHAPDEYYVIESKNPKVAGITGAVHSHVEFLYALSQS